MLSYLAIQSKKIFSLRSNAASWLRFASYQTFRSSTTPSSTIRRTRSGNIVAYTCPR
jgi:hypothetical protein